MIKLFNWTNLFGKKIHCVSNEPSVVDSDCACRTLIFEQLTDNNLAKTVGGVTRITPREIYAKESEN